MCAAPFQLLQMERFLSFGSGVGCSPVRIPPLFPRRFTLLFEQPRLALEFLFVDFAVCKLRRPAGGLSPAAVTA